MIQTGVKHRDQRQHTLKSAPKSSSKIFKNTGAPPMGAITYPHDFPVAETRGRWDFCFLVRSLEVIPIAGETMSIMFVNYILTVYMDIWLRE